MSTLGAVGFYGKMPALGDFVSRRLPRQFIDPWDGWLQGAFAASREQLGSGWMDAYLNSPIWRFAVTAGLLGDAAWAGILMPSVDRVGRYFPLTLAAPVGEAIPLLLLFDGACEWFEHLETVALSVLAEGFDFEEFDATLRDAIVATQRWIGGGTTHADGRVDGGRFAVQGSVTDPTELVSAFAAVGAVAIDRSFPAYSLWCSEGSEALPPAVLLCEGLPPIGAYAALLAGHCEQRAWNLVSWRKAGAEPAASGRGIAASEPPGAGAETRPAAMWQSHGITHVGQKRRINQDAFIERPDMGLWAVADGMGGHQAGEVASGLIVAALNALSPDVRLNQLIDRVRESMAAVNTQLQTMADRQGGGGVIGSTVVALLIAGAQGAALWAGDSRLYRYRDNRLEQLTRDHSLLDEIFGDDLPGNQQAVAKLRANVITRAVGADEAVELDLQLIDVRQSDVYLLCTDGLDKEVDDATIAASLSEGDCRTNAEALIKAALENGARDNVTVVVVRAA